jgi:hypothetical protein
LLLEKIQQHGAIQFPTQGETKKIAVAMQWIGLIGK